MLVHFYIWCYKELLYCTKATLFIKCAIRKKVHWNLSVTAIKLLFISFYVIKDTRCSVMHVSPPKDMLNARGQDWVVLQTNIYSLPNSSPFAKGIRFCIIMWIFHDYPNLSVVPHMSIHSVINSVAHYCDKIKKHDLEHFKLKVASLASSVLFLQIWLRHKNPLE